MRLVADENLPWVEEFFKDSAQITRLPGAAISREQLQQADALLVRSVTQVTPELLAGTPVRFVGTATIGTDHVDVAGLEAAGIHFASAPGCNASAVVDYVITNLLWWSEAQGLSLQELTVGIVGVGQVGGRLAERLKAWGCSVLCNDPPRQAKGDPGLVGLSELLQRADLVSLHTPLTWEGPFPTRHLIDEQELALFKGRLLINAGRGAVINPQALSLALQKDSSLQVILDVFADEPNLDPELLQHLTLATPHIAGYSLEGKSRGTEAIYQAWCNFWGLEVRVHLDSLLPAPAAARLQLNPGWSAEEAARRAALLVYDPREDAARLKRALEQLAPAEAYQQLRKNYPVRRELASLKVQVATARQAEALAALGFDVITP